MTKPYWLLPLLKGSLKSRLNHIQLVELSRVMNRKKKIKQILTKKMKKANAKLAPKDSKPAYVSKADRAAAEAAVNQQNDNELA